MRFEQRDRQPADLRRWLACVGAFLLIAAGLAWLHQSGVAVCLFHRLTGLPCLTCGASRAAAMVLRGDVLGALKLQPLATAGGACAGVVCGVYSCFLLLRRRVVRVHLSLRESRLLWAAAGVLAVLNWVYLVRCGV